MYKIILAIRYLVKRRISYFSIAATALCVFVVFVVITVLSGLTSEFKRNTYLSVGDCVVSSKSLVGFGYYGEFISALEETDFVEASSPVVRSYGFVSGAADPNMMRYHEYTLEVIGVDPAAHSRVTGFGQWLQYNKGDVTKAFAPNYDPNLVGCVVGIGIMARRTSEGGYEVAEKLSRVKFEINCFPLTAKGALAKAGAGEMSTKTFYLSDTAESGVARADWNRIYLPIDQAQMLCGMAGQPKRVNAIYVKFKPEVRLDTGCKKVRKLWEEFVEQKTGVRQANLLEKVSVQSWKIYNRSAVAVAETQQTVMIFCFGMIGIIMVFIVLVVFYMIVSHKSKDIGILKSVGVSNGNILSLFLGFAFLVGIIGSAIGALGGWRFLVHINQIEDWLFRHFQFQLFDRRLYAIGDIPNAIDLEVLAGIILSAIVACLVGALIPSWQAARLRPVETLQVSQL